MLNTFRLLFLLFPTADLLSQQTANSDKLSISVPFVWNSSKGVYYSLGSRKEPQGDAVSYGIQLNYRHMIYNDIFIFGGLGLYKQRFNIRRPFRYKTPDGTEPLVYTNRYSYDNLQLQAGLGYKKEFRNKWSVSGHASYNYYHSFRQEFEQQYLPGQNEIYKRNMQLGSAVNFGLEVALHVNRNISVGAGLILPLYTNWGDDELFIKYDYADDTQKIAYTNFCVGAGIWFFYHLTH